MSGFWKLPKEDELRTPLLVLREQAAALTESTNGVLRGEASTTKVSGVNVEAGTSRTSLKIIVPAMNNYVYRILYYTQPILMYPGTLRFVPTGVNTVIKSFTAFCEVIEVTLSSEETQEVLSVLIAQAKSEIDA